MKIQVADAAGKVYNLEIDPTDTIFMLKGKVSRQAGNPSVHGIKIFWQGKELDHFSNFIQNQIQEGSILQCQLPAAAPQPQPVASANFFGGNQRPMVQPQLTPQNFANDPNLMQQALQLKEQFVNDSNRLNQLLEQDPELAQALLSDNIQDAMIIIGTRVPYDSCSSKRNTWKNSRRPRKKWNSITIPSMLRSKEKLKRGSTLRE